MSLIDLIEPKLKDLAVYSFWKISRWSADMCDDYMPPLGARWGFLAWDLINRKKRSENIIVTMIVIATIYSK